MTITHDSAATPNAVTADVVLSAVRHRNDTEHRFQRVIRSEAGTFTAETTPWLPTTTWFSNGGQGLPWSDLVAIDHQDLVTLLRATPALTVLLHEATQFTIADRSITRAELVDLLRPSAAGLAVRPVSGSTPEPADDEDLEDGVEVEGATSLGLWASIDGEGVVVLDLGSEPSASRSTDLVAIPLDGDEGGVRGAARIASYSWWSEGEITSWDGGAVIERIGRSAALFRDTGDSLDTPTIVRWPTSVRAQADVLERWLDQHDAGVAAALCWEPLDPTGRRLTAREPGRWEAADEGPSHAHTRGALLHPRHPGGEELYERLDAVACGGPLWDLLNG